LGPVQVHRHPPDPLDIGQGAASRVRALLEAGLDVLAEVVVGPLIAAGLAPEDLDEPALVAAWTRVKGRYIEREDPLWNIGTPPPPSFPPYPRAALPPAWLDFADALDELRRERAERAAMIEMPDPIFL